MVEQVDDVGRSAGHRITDEVGAQASQGSRDESAED